MRRQLVIFGLVAALIAPVSASAQVGFNFSFGGRVVSLPIPCINLPGSYGFVIFPAGRFGPTYVYTPFLSFGLGPTYIGQQVLGLARTLPVLCNGVPAFHVQLIGTSLLPF
jgi:hypothetical protein